MQADFWLTFLHTSVFGGHTQFVGVVFHRTMFYRSIGKHIQETVEMGFYPGLIVFAPGTVHFHIGQHFQQSMADKVLVGQHHNLAGGAGDGKGAYQFFLWFVQLQYSQLGNEGDAFAAFHHAHESLHAA